MPLFEIHPWKLIERGFHPESMRLSESLASIGNGAMGMRGNFEEKYSGDSHQGTYLGGVWFPDKTRVGWWKNGYPSYFGKAINAVNMIGIDVTVDGVFEDAQAGIDAAKAGGMKAVGISVPGVLTGFDAAYESLGEINLQSLLAALNGLRPGGTSS